MPGVKPLPIRPPAGPCSGLRAEQSTGFEKDWLWRVLLGTRPTTVEGLHEFAPYALAETHWDMFSDVLLEALRAIDAGPAALTGRVPHRPEQSRPLRIALCGHNSPTRPANSTSAL